MNSEEILEYPSGTPPAVEAAQLVPPLTVSHHAAVEPTQGTTSSLQRILVLDNEPSIVEVLTRALRRSSYHVGSANDGEAGWLCLQTEAFDLLITDHDMPRLKGLDLVRRLRAHKYFMPVILISGNLPRGEADFETLLTPGVALVKPFELGPFLVHVRMLLFPAI